jgi:lipid-A-disaccharide synthase
MKIFFSVGEPSGDLHGANLIRELRRRVPDVQCVGFGGPQMAAAGCHLHTDLTRFAVMWFWRVLINLHHFYMLWRQAERATTGPRYSATARLSTSSRDD